MIDDGGGRGLGKGVLWAPMPLATRALSQSLPEGERPEGGRFANRSYEREVGWGYGARPVRPMSLSWRGASSGTETGGAKAGLGPRLDMPSMRG